MYKRILVPLENGPADNAILKHVAELAKLLGAEVVLVHVADGWAARTGTTAVEKRRTITVHVPAGIIT